MKYRCRPATRWRIALPLGLLILLCAPSLLAGTQHFQAPLTTVKWAPSAGKLHCSLSHDIPLYGRAVFARSAGHALGFRMDVKQGARREGDRARLRSLPPGWRHAEDGLDLGEIEVRRGNTPFQLGEPLARRMLAELQKGMSPTFSYRDWADARDLVSVSLPGVNFRQAMEAFTTCLAELPVYDFADYRETVVHFAPGNEALNPKARQRLDAIAKYLSTDPTVKKILIEGHTDDIGQYRDNDKLGQRRSLAIRNYLQAAGVPAAKFELRSFGERRPVYTNTTDEGRARNRRARVTLLRENVEQASNRH